MSRSSLIPASSSPIATFTPAAANRFSGATPERRRKLEEQLWHDARPGLRHPVDIPLVQPHAMAERHALGQQGRTGRGTLPPCTRPAARHMPSDTPSPPDAYAAARPYRSDASASRLQRRIRAPMQVRRRELDFHPLLPRMSQSAGCRNRSMQPSSVIWNRSNHPCHRPAQLRRQRGHERRVVLVHQPVLVPHRVAVGHAHADILVGADHLVRTSAAPPPSYPAASHGCAAPS